MNITPRVNMVTRQKAKFSLLLFVFYPLIYFIFEFQYLQNSIPWGSSFALCFDLSIHLHAKDDTASLLTSIYFFYITFAIICFVPNLIPIFPRSYGLFVPFSFNIKIKLKNININVKLST